MAAGAIAAALGGALFIALGFVVQQHAAAEEPPDERLSPRLLIHLARRPLWLMGIGSMVVGQILGAVALGRGSLALVTPLMATNLLFALPLAALWHRRRLRLRDWLGAAVLVAGLAAFIAAGDPSGGNTTRLPWPNWAIAGGSVFVLAGLGVLISKRRPAATQATMLAASAGVLYGLQDALTSRTLAGFAHGIVAILVSWPVFALFAVALVALLVGQSAFEAAPLVASLPAITVAEPITGVVFGVGVFNDHLAIAEPRLPIEVVGLVAMLAGVIILARSPVVTGATAQAKKALGEWREAA